MKIGDHLIRNLKQKPGSPTYLPFCATAPFWHSCIVEWESSIHHTQLIETQIKQNKTMLIYKNEQNAKSHNHYCLNLDCLDNGLKISNNFYCCENLIYFENLIMFEILHNMAWYENNYIDVHLSWVF